MAKASSICLLTLAGLVAGACSSPVAKEAIELSGPLSADDECQGDQACSTNALQKAQGLRRVDVERYRQCVDYGCANRYVRQHHCQCNAACKRYGNCCGDFDDTCADSLQHPSSDEVGPIMTLYHQTSPEIGELILKGGFKPGRHGWCGGAIYLAESPRETITKASGVNSHHGFMIEAIVRLGRVKKMPSWCDMSMTGEKLELEGYDSILFNPVDGDEHVIYNHSRVLSTRRFPFTWR